MARIFYTEDDIEDLARRGVKEIEETEDVYITDVAREKMEALGIIAKKPAARGVFPKVEGGALSENEKAQVIERVRSGVIARLGSGVDVTVVDTIVRRVVNQL